jgi:lysine N6-hydroxylase
VTEGDVLALAGVGIGPFNLSLAAQLDSVPGIEARFFERQPVFDWHPGMMLPGVTLQTSFLKDLVTATNPTSRWSFVSYLVAHRRFYDYLNADFAAVPRQEFANYLAWVASHLDSLAFGSAVREIGFDGSAFVLRLDNETRRAGNLALGIGLEPAVPAFARGLPERLCFHSSRAKSRLRGLAGKRVAIVGGGQSGAEILLHLLEQEGAVPASVSWISKRPNFLPLDETPFTNELFTPAYVERFHALPEARRRATVARDKLAGSGVSAATLQAIFRRLYSLRHIERSALTTELLPHREVMTAELEDGGVRLMLRNGFDGAIERQHADIVVLATGYGFALPDCLAPLAGRCQRDETGRPLLSADFAMQWDGPKANRIFALNAGLVSHGIAEPQLSLMAWRSAVIVNALLGRAHFDVAAPDSFVDWTAAATQPVRPASREVASRLSPAHA